MTFTNWAGNVHATPARRVAPASEDEVARLVREARAAGRRARVVGSGHSWSPLVPTSGDLVSLERMASVLGTDVARGVVRAQAGCTLHALLEALAAVGLALPIVGSVDAQTLGGLTATGTHGSSLTWGNISSLVRRMVLIDGRGERVALEHDDPRLEGGRVHLGALGVVTELDLHVVPAFKLRESITRAPVDEVAHHLAGVAKTHTYVKMMWLPHTRDAILFAYEPVDPGTPGEVSPLAWEVDAALSRWVFPALLALGGRWPRLVPMVNRLVDRIKFLPGTRVGRSDRILKLPMPPRHRETEVSLPLAEAGRALLFCRDWLAERRAVNDFLLEARFVPADPAWLSPAYGRDSCQFGVYATHSPTTDAFFADFRAAAATWTDEPARPHWGKELDVGPGDVERWYPRAGDFRALAAALDPDRVFVNPMLAAVLGA